MKKKDSVSEDLLKNEDSLFRIGVLAQLYQSKPKDIPNPTPVAACLMDTHPAVPHLAVAVLKRMGKPAIPALIQALDSNRETSLRQTAAAALATFGIDSTPAVPALCACLESNVDDLRWHAGYALAQIGPPAVPALNEMLQSSDNTVLVSVLASFELMGEKAGEATEKIKAFADHSDPRVRMQCSATLIKVSGDPTNNLPKMLSLLAEEPDPTFRAEYLEKIGLLGSAARDGEKNIVKYFTDSSPVVRAAAAIALARTGSDFSSSKTEWLMLLTDPDQDVRTNAVMSIASYGRQASAAISILEKMSQQEFPDLANMAKAALAKIIGDPCEDCLTPQRGV